MGDIGSTMAILMGVGAFFVIVLLYTIITMLQICDPAEVIIISGRTSKLGPTHTVGYAPKQGWVVRWPVIERLHRMDLRNMTVDVKVTDAYSKEGVPLTIEGVANLKISGRQPLLHNAVERFMGMPRNYIERIARETLEGNLRGVLATLTPEEVNHDKMKFAESLVEEADKDLQRLGLELDNLKIQNIRDDEGYLDCIGRVKQAEQQQKNRIGELTNHEQAGVREAQNLKAQRLTEFENKMKVARKKAETRIAEARTRREAVVAEERAKVAQALARAQAEVGVYEALIEQVGHQLQADVLQPAEAERQKALADARAQVASIRETGKATAEMLGAVIDALAGGGPEAMEVFRMQKLDGFLGALVRTIPEAPVDRLTMVGSGGGAGGFPLTAASTNEQLKGAVGVDLAGAVQAMAERFGGGGGVGPARLAAPSGGAAGVATARAAAPAAALSPPAAAPAKAERKQATRKVSPPPVVIDDVPEVFGSLADADDSEVAQRLAAAKARRRQRLEKAAGADRAEMLARVAAQARARAQQNQGRRA